MNLLIKHIGHGGGVPGGLHHIFIKKNGQLSQPVVPEHLGHEGIVDHRVIATGIHKIIHERHALLTRWTGVGLDHNQPFAARLGGHIKQVGPCPAQVLAVVVQEISENFAVHRRMKVHVAADDALFIEIQQKSDQRMNLCVEHFGVIMLRGIKSLYVRVDMSDKASAELAYLQNPQIIVNNKSRDGSLRAAAAKIGIPAITVEVGDPQMFQKRLIRFSLIGLHNIIGHFKMLPLATEKGRHPPILCDRSYWIYTTHGGILEVLPHVAERVQKGDLIARQTNQFGDIVQEYIAPEDGIVVGKSTNPISPTGARILHLGLEKG